MAGQDDTTVSKDRFDGLMSAFNKLQTENRELRAGIAAQEPNADGDGGLAAAGQWEPGTKLVVGDDGQLTELEPPTPQNPNASNYASRRFGDPTGRAKQDDGSPEYAREQMLSVLGGKPDAPKGWLG